MWYKCTVYSIPGIHVILAVNKNSGEKGVTAVAKNACTIYRRHSASVGAPGALVAFRVLREGKDEIDGTHVLGRALRFTTASTLSRGPSSRVLDRAAGPW